MATWIPGQFLGILAGSKHLNVCHWSVELFFLSSGRRPLPDLQLKLCRHVAHTFAGHSAHVRSVHGGTQLPVCRTHLKTDVVPVAKFGLVQVGELHPLRVPHCPQLDEVWVLPEHQGEPLLPVQAHHADEGPVVEPGKEEVGIDTKGLQ